MLSRTKSLRRAMKKLQKATIRQLKIEKFFKEDLWQLLIVTAFLLCYAWIFNKWIETILFSISHTIIRMYFGKQFHCGKIYKCLFLTCTIAFFGVMCIMPLSVSLLSCVPMCFFISWVGYIVQDRIDCITMLRKVSHKTIWQMDENELADYCYAKGVRGDMLEFVIMVLIYQMKYEEIGKKLGYSVDTLKDWSPKCKAKLGIKSWKHE